MSTDIVTKTKTLLDFPDSIYFEREQAVIALIQHLTRDFFVSIIGESGSGKSTLANLTLTEALESGRYQGRAGKKWRIIKTMPFADPLGNLAGALAEPGNLFPKGARDTNFRQQVESRLRDEGEALVHLYNEAIAAWDEAFNLLLIVDQKQELFRYQSILQNSGKAGDDVRYVNLLLSATRSASPVYIIFITDNRYIEYFSRYRGLPEKMNNYRFTVPNITPDEIRASLEPYLPPAKSDEDPSGKQRAFVDTLIKDFKNLLGSDQYALQKLNLCLSLVISKWKDARDKAPEGKMPDDPMPFYQENGPLGGTISRYISQDVFNNLNFTSEEKNHVELLFRALTEKGGNNQYIRRPVRMQELQLLANRTGQQILPFEYIKALLDKFNRSNEKFIRITGPLDVSPDAIVDINTESLLYNWPELAEWIEEESTHADVYRNLVRDALNYYAPEEAAQEKPAPTPREEERTPGLAGEFFNLVKGFLKVLFPGKAVQKQTTADRETEGSGVYDGASLISALKWKERCNPNPTWAARYLSPPTPKLNGTQRRQLSSAFPGKEEGQLTNLFIAQEFLRLSEGRYNDELEQKQRDVEKARRQRTLATRLALASVVLGILAGVFWYSAWNERNNLKLADFVQVLDYNYALNLSVFERFDVIRVMTDTISRSSKLNSRRDVLHFLNERRVINIDPDLPELADFSYRSLINIDDFYREHEKDRGHQKSFRDIENIYRELQEKQRDGVYLQFPYVYYALYSHVFDIKSALGEQDYLSTTAVEPGGLAPNPLPDDELLYALGDKNGDVFLVRSSDSIRLPNAGGVIKSIAFYPDGKTLLAGTELGAIYRYDRLDLSPGVAGQIKTHVFTDPNLKSMYFVRPWPADTNLVFVSNTFQTYFLKRNARGLGLSMLAPPMNLPLQRVDFRVWSPRDGLFLTGGMEKNGRNSTFIYRLQPSDIKAPIQPVGKINHGGHNIVNLAIKTDDNARVWLALGSEYGDIWIAKNMDLNFLESEQDITDSTVFQRMDKVHDSSISGL
ncbi:MAG: hypothetical protein L6Q97_02095, partial [Thermoanaerobaculia bacterium]|nr:hypothetical protein [Thermoanaerobaculia bacterium]